MDNGLFRPGSGQRFRTADEALDSFLRGSLDAARPDRPFVLAGFIDQFGAPQERLTCEVAARLNVLVGLGSISTGEASKAHNALAGSDSLRWQKPPGMSYALPAANYRQTIDAFNRPGLLPVGVALSETVLTRNLSEPCDVLDRALGSEVGVVIGRSDRWHTYAAVPHRDRERTFRVVDSIIPQEPRAQGTDTIVRELQGDPDSTIQLIYGRMQLG